MCVCVCVYRERGSERLRKRERAIEKQSCPKVINLLSRKIDSITFRY